MGPNAIRTLPESFTSDMAHQGFSNVPLRPINSVRSHVKDFFKIHIKKSNPDERIPHCIDFLQK
jgi:hypothetical protein